MSIPQSGGGPIEDRAQLAQYLADGCKPRADWRIGTEHEKFGYCKDTHEPLPYEGVRSIRAMLEGLRDGAVQVDEGQITYFGPLTGGSVALRDMDRLSLERQMFPAHWRLDQSGQPPLFIPVNAEGSEALFDAFAVLPGIRTERMLFELRKTRHDPVLIWERPPERPAHMLLH